MDTALTSLADPRGDRPRVRKRGKGFGLAREGRALVRFFRDADASLLGKAFVLAVAAYVVCPVDMLPDVAPVIGWLDDLGLAGVAMLYLSRVLDPYRT